MKVLVTGANGQLGRSLQSIVSGPAAEENYFSQGFAKNQFSPAIAEPTRADAISRADIGLEPRKCLLCDNEVRYCMRAKTHTTAELLARIEEMVKLCCDF